MRACALIALTLALLVGCANPFVPETGEKVPVSPQMNTMAATIIRQKVEAPERVVGFGDMSAFKTGPTQFVLCGSVMVTDDKGQNRTHAYYVRFEQPGTSAGVALFNVMDSYYWTAPVAGFYRTIPICKPT